MAHPLNKHCSDRSQTGDHNGLVIEVTSEPDTDAVLPARPATDRTPGVGAKKHFSCAFVHGPGAGSVMKTDSLTEKRVAFVLQARADVADLENQVLFTWGPEDGPKERHFFDFRATMTDGSRVAIMVKYDEKLSDEEFFAKSSRIAAEVTADFADRVTLMTEKHLDPVAVHNATLLNAVRKPDPDADAIMRDMVSNLIGAAKIGDLIAHTGLGGRGFRSIARLIGAHELELRGRVRIDYDSHVMRRAA
ncbi:hypothetical protein [Salipiger sp.]|uniref:hypothetical protein n=1 Tax=Salipiger sp. TaxID=2078585 RepID=UPI003A97C408